ncbi:hypothetical protein D3C72_1836380 [compost metagenome]
MVRVFPSGVLTPASGKLATTPLVTMLMPPTLRVFTPSGALMLKLPVTVVDSLLVSDPADSFAPRSDNRSSSYTMASPPSPFGIRLVMVTPSSSFLMVRVRVAVLTSPSASVRV